MVRREYDIDIVFNGKRIKKVIIDPHYELKHADSVSDGVILGLVKFLNGMNLPPKNVKPSYSYFDLDKIKYRGKSYKLIWVLEDDQIYIGVVNAYRR